MHWVQQIGLDGMREVRRATKEGTMEWNKMEEIEQTDRIDLIRWTGTRRDKMYGMGWIGWE